MNHEVFTDTYFRRTKQILQAENFNPTVRMKVFARKGTEWLGGGEAINWLRNTLKKEDRSARCWALPPKTKYRPMEPLMILEGKAQALVDKETVYLGMLSHELSVRNSNWDGKIDPQLIHDRAKELVEIAGKIPILYMGARHYHYNHDATIASACLDAGFIGASTDVGAMTHKMKGRGTTPHFLTLCCAYRYGFEIATAMAMRLFDKHMPGDVPRVMLVDTFNKEISDSIATADVVPNLGAVRLDTCGSNISEGAHPHIEGKDPEFKTGRGVTIESATLLRQALDEAGHEKVGIFLSSGFGNPKKLQAFMDTHDDHKCVGFGVGEVVPAIFTTSDIYEIEGQKVAKRGREVARIDFSRLRRQF